MKTILECLERILEAGLSALSCMGAFLMITLLINLLWDGTMTAGHMFSVFAVSVMLVYYMDRGLAKVQHELVMMSLDEMEDEDAD